MKKTLVLCFSIFAFIFCFGQNERMVSTVAGIGHASYNGDFQKADDASLNYPSGICTGAKGSIYIADTENHRIRKVHSNGQITTIAGCGKRGYSGDGGAASAAMFNRPTDVLLLQTGELLIADSENHCIRKVNLDGSIETFFGTGQPEMVRESGTGLHQPYSLAMGSEGILYVSESGSNWISTIDKAKNKRVLAGTGIAGHSGDGGDARTAKLSNPKGIAIEEDGSLLIADAGNDRIRKVSPDGVIDSYMGTDFVCPYDDKEEPTQKKLESPVDVISSHEGVIVVDQKNQLTKVDRDGLVESVLSDFGGTIASVAVDKNGTIYFTDRKSHTLQKLAIPEKGPTDVVERNIIQSPDTELSIYPNPTSERVTVEFSTDIKAELTCQIIDRHGRLVKQLRVPEGSRLFELSLLGQPSASYRLLLYDKAELVAEYPIILIDKN